MSPAGDFRRAWGTAEKRLFLHDIGHIRRTGMDHFPHSQAPADGTGVQPRSGAKISQKAFWIGVFLACAGTFAPSGCHDRTAPAARNIVLIVIDTMRADRLGALGADPSPTPALDRLAARAQLFEQARTTAPFTMPATASLMTGRYPDGVGIRNHSVADRLSEQAPTIAELARAAGYRTAAVVTNPWLARPSSGFRRGFERFVTGRDRPPGTDDATGWRMSAAGVANAAIEILAADHNAPTFVWVHFMDAHMPYTPSPTYADKRAPRAQASHTLANFADEDFDRQALYFSAADADDIEIVRTAYDAAIETVDHEISRILATLDDDDIVIVAADHGESLGEHGLFFAHDFTLYRVASPRAADPATAGDQAGAHSNASVPSRRLTDFVRRDPAHLPERTRRGCAPDGIRPIAGFVRRLRARAREVRSLPLSRSSRSRGALEFVATRKSKVDPNSRSRRRPVRSLRSSIGPG